METSDDNTVNNTSDIFRVDRCSMDPYNSTIIYPPLPEYPAASWKYEMRREMQEICTNVYFGSYASATKKKLDELKSEGFTHIVCVRHMLERRVIKPNFPEHFIYKIVEMNENSIESIIPRCMTVCEFVTESLDQGGKVLIHGNSGAGSSAILIIAFVMFRFGVSPKEAHHYVQQRRFCIRPTDHFLDQLKEFEPIFQAKQLKLMWNQMNFNGIGHDGTTGTGSDKCGVKRNIDDSLQSDGHGHENEAIGLKRVLDDGVYSEQEPHFFDHEGNNFCEYKMNENSTTAIAMDSGDMLTD